MHLAIPYFAASVLIVPVLTMTTAMMIGKATWTIVCVLSSPRAMAADHCVLLLLLQL